MVRRKRFIYRKSSFGHREGFGVTSIVPGPPEGSRGSTGWGHLSWRAPWAEGAWEQAPGGLVRPPWASHAPRGGGASTWLGGQATPRAAAPSLDGIYKGLAPP